MTSCPTCHTELQQATIDLAERSDETDSLDQPRAEFDPRSMVAVDFCPNPDCPDRKPGGEVTPGRGPA